jgi:hypothetical protein
MGKHGGRWLVLCLAMVACLADVGCTGTPPSFHMVTITPKGPVVVASGGTQTLTAQVLNDTSGAGVNWTPPVHGTLTAVTTTSATYNAPVVAPGTTVSDTVKATSVTFPNQSSSVSLMVEGAPVISTTSLPAGNQGTPYSGTVSATGGVAPFAWSISSGSLPTGLSLGASTSNSVMITGNPGTQGTFNFTIKITDASGASGTEPLSITINAPLPLSVTTTSLPNGVLNTAYPSTTLQATGGVPPFTWTVTSGSLPTGLALAANGTISGTPTATGTSDFTVEVTDSEKPAMTASASLSITVNNLGALNGDYAFELVGFNTSGSVAVAGSFTANGLGAISNGVEDFNSTSGSPKNQTFTGTYTLTADNRGTLTFASLAGSPTYAFAIDSTGSYGRMIEFDSSGIRGSGQIEKRTGVTTCAFNTLNGPYAYGLTGNAVNSALTTAGPVVLVGTFNATPPPPPGTVAGSIGTGESDANMPSGITPGDQTVSGSFATTSESTRCSMSLSQKIGTMVFSVYPVSPTEAFLVETDQVNSSEPFLMSGKLLQQVGYPFTGAAGSTFTATSVAGLTGQFLSGTTYVPDLALVLLAGTGAQTYTITVLDNRAGVVTAYAPTGATFANPDQYGRIDSGISSPISPILYTINENEAFVIGELVGDPFFGVLEPQSPIPFTITASGLNGSFVMGTSYPATPAVPDLSGTVTLANTSATAGTINGTEDLSTSSGNTADQTVTGTYASLVSATGSGLVTLTAPSAFSGQFLAVSSTKLVILTTTAGDAEPTLLYLGNCANTCGEN